MNRPDRPAGEASAHATPAAPTLRHFWAPFAFLYLLCLLLAQGHADVFTFIGIVLLFALVGRDYERGRP